MAPSIDGSHIVMLPFMAHSHLVLFLALARQIWLQSRFAVTVANTPVNVRRIRSAATGDPSLAVVDFAKLAICASNHGLSSNTENTKNMPLTQMTALSYVSLSLRAQLVSLVADITCREGGRPPVCIFFDIFFDWAVDVAKAFGTKNYGFTTCRAYRTLVHVSLWLHLPHRGIESSKFVVPGFPEQCLFDKSGLVVLIREANGEDMWSRFLWSQFELSLSSSGWLCNTSEKFELLGAAALRNLVKLSVWTIGPLLPDAIVKDEDSLDSLNFISEH